MANDSAEPNQRQRVEIMGEILPVKTSDENTRTRDAVKLVEDKIEAIRNQSTDANRLQIALLTALNLGGQLVQLEETPDELGFSDDTLDRMDKLSSRIDQLLNEDTDK